MGDYSKPLSEDDLLVNFEQIHPLMNATMAANASAKCLYCYDAPCVAACPSDVDIPLFIKQIGSGNVLGAAKTIYSTNYFGQICGKVCPTEVLCEGACVFNEQDITPVEIGALQTFACNEAIRSDLTIAKNVESNNKKIAVIGAGPSGIACACELCSMGYEVDVFEARERPSGLALHGTAPYKILNREVKEELDYLETQFGFTLKLIHPVHNPSELEGDYSAVFLGIGLGRTRLLQIPGEEIKGNYLASEFIEQVKLDALSVDPGQNVLVIGGGNTAMDAASESARLGAERVTIAYRRGKESMSAYEFEFALTQKVGVSALFNVNPVRVIGEESVTGVEFVNTVQEGGSIRIIEGSSFRVKCDVVINATGQEKLLEFLSKIDGLRVDGKGRIQINEYGQTENPMYFAAGDAVNGGAEVVNAVAEGKITAKGIDRWLRRAAHIN